MPLHLRPARDAGRRDGPDRRAPRARPVCGVTGQRRAEPARQGGEHGPPGSGLGTSGGDQTARQPASRHRSGRATRLSRLCLTGGGGRQSGESDGDVSSGAVRRAQLRHLGRRPSAGRRGTAPRRVTSRAAAAPPQRASRVEPITTPHLIESPPPTPVLPADTRAVPGGEKRALSALALIPLTARYSPLIHGMAR